MNPALWHPTKPYSQNEPCTANGGYIYASKIPGQDSNTGLPPALLGDDNWLFFYDIAAWMTYVANMKADAV